MVPETKVLTTYASKTMKAKRDMIMSEVAQIDNEWS